MNSVKLLTNHSWKKGKENGGEMKEKIKEGEEI